jgi:hypothetical protein
VNFWGKHKGSQGKEMKILLQYMRNEILHSIPKKWNSLPEKRILSPPKDKAVSMVVALLLT